MSDYENAVKTDVKVKILVFLRGFYIERYIIIILFSGAGGGTRTHTMSPSADFESATSTIPSHRLIVKNIYHLD